MNTTNRDNSKSNERNVGIDVGKDSLDICVYESDQAWPESNTQEGIRRLVKRLKRFRLTRVLVEATGGYERLLVEACTEFDIPIVIVVDPAYSIISTTTLSRLVDQFFHA